VEVNTFDATCGEATATHLGVARKWVRADNSIEEVMMTMREKIEVAAFGGILIIGLPALIVATQRIAA